MAQTGLYDSTVDTEADLQFLGTGPLVTATLVPTIVNGKITNVTITNSGAGYKVAPTYKIKSTNDKVTIYRALSAFEKKCLIHRVPDKSNLIRYALCQKECSKIHHKHNHAHFICNVCAQTFCLDNIKLPQINDTSGFKINKTKLTLEGACPSCY